MTAADSASPARSPLAVYGIALLSIALATGLRLLLDGLLGDRLPFITYFIAIVFMAWYAGWWPSFVVMSLGYLAAVYFFIPPRGSLVPTRLTDQIGMALYFFVGAVSALLGESQRRAQGRVEASMREALAKQRELEREIAQRTRTEEALRDSETRYRILTESLPQLVWTCLPDGRCDYLSRQWIAYTGIPEAAQLGYGWIEQVHPDDRRHVQEVWAAAVRDGTLFDVEFRIRRADGHYRWFKTRAVPLSDQSGCIVKWFGSNTDIDELRRAEAEIRQQAETLERRVRERTAALSDAKEWFQALIETTSDWIWEVDRNGTYTYASPRVKDILGYEPEALIGKTPFALMPPDEAERVAAQFRAIVEAQAPFAGLENTNLHMSGRRVVLETSGVPFFDNEGRVLGYRGVDRDITMRKQVEEAVQTARDFYLKLLDEFPTPVWRAGLDAKCDWFNKTWLAFTGRTMAQELGDGWAEGVHPDDRERCVADYLRAFEAREPFVMEYRLRRHDGTYRWIMDVGRPFNDLNGNFAGYVGSCYDFTERKQAEEDLSHSREMFRLVVNNVPQHVFWKDRNLEYLGCNLLFAEAAGVAKPADIVGKTDFDLAWKDMAERYRADDRSVMDTKAPKLNFEEPQTRPDGTLLWLRTSKVPLIGRTGQVLGVLGIYEDITARKEMEARANRLERLAAMGQLLSGIAHELKNPLFILTGYLRIGQETLAQRRYEALSEEWKKIQDVTKRLEDITERFLRLALPIAGQRQRCSMPEILGNVLDLARNELEQNRIRARATFAPDLPDTWLDEKQVREVFLNLVMNAIQSMAEAHGQGTLTVSAHLPPADAQPSASEERWIEVRIQDDGAGISSEIQSKIFEPFFTTKPAGKGTGLGLWIVRSNLMMLHGSVRFETEVGRGTTFVVRLPVVEEPSADLPAPEKGHDRQDRP